MNCTAGKLTGAAVGSLRKVPFHNWHEFFPLFDSLRVLSFLGDEAQAALDFFDTLVEFRQFIGEFLDNVGELFGLFFLFFVGHRAPVEEM